MNTVQLMGRLTKDVELRNSADGKTTIARYGLAVPRLYGKQGEVDFFNIVAFNKGAEFVSKYFHKGSMIAITGRLQMNQWQDQSGVKHTSVDVIAENQFFTGERTTSQTETQSKTEDVDLPF